MINQRSKIINILIYSIFTISVLTFNFLVFSFDTISNNVFYYHDIFNSFPQPYYELLLGLITLFVLTLAVLISCKNKLYFYIWLLKILITFTVIGYFEYINTGLDQYLYYGYTLFKPIEFLSITSGTDTIILINKILTLFFGNSYYSLKILHSFLSFIGLILFYKTFLHILEKSNLELKEHRLSYIIIVLPTVLIWTSLIGKDSITLFIIGLFIFSFIKLIDTKKKLYLFFLILSIIGALFIRKWIPFIMIASIVFYILIFSRQRYLYLGIFVLFSFIAYLYGVQFFFDLFPEYKMQVSDLFYHLGDIQQSFSRGNTAQDLPLITSLSDYIKYYIPNLFITLFMPLPFLSTNSIFMWFFAFENLFILLGVIPFIILNIKYVLKNKYLVFLLVFIFCWSLIYVILSPGNLGTAIRYKAQVWPIIMMIIMVSFHYKRSKRGK